MNSEVIIIGISGPSASGKSLLATTLMKELGSQHVQVISEDSYYKDRGDIPFEERVNINYDHPESLEHSLLIDHLKQMQRGENIEVPIYDYSQHCRSETVQKVGKHRIIVLEGILLFVEPELRDLMDIRIFMDTPLDICLTRRIKRDTVERKRTVDSILEQYLKTVRPMYFQFIEPSKRYADVIVPKGGENRIAIEMIQAKMRELLSQN